MSTGSAAATVPAPLPFAEPTPMGLFGLSIGCAALMPLALGVPDALTPEGLAVAAWFCLLFGAGGQFLAGMMSFANRNLLGGTLFTTFSFNWVVNWWALSRTADAVASRSPEAIAGLARIQKVVLCTDATFLVIFIAMTFAFGLFSKLLFAFLLDIDVLYVARILKEVLHAPALGMLVALATVVLVAISLYIACALLLNASAGRMLLPFPGPMFRVPPAAPAAPAPAAPAPAAPAAG